MKKQHFTEEQIAFAFRQVESGTPMDADLNSATPPASALYPLSGNDNAVRKT